MAIENSGSNDFYLHIRFLIAAYPVWTRLEFVNTKTGGTYF